MDNMAGGLGVRMVGGRRRAVLEGGWMIGWLVGWMIGWF